MGVSSDRHILPPLRSEHNWRLWSAVLQVAGCPGHQGLTQVCLVNSQARENAHWGPSGLPTHHLEGHLRSDSLSLHWCVYSTCYCQREIKDMLLSDGWPTSQYLSSNDVVPIYGSVLQFTAYNQENILTWIINIFVSNMFYSQYQINKAAIKVKPGCCHKPVKCPF